MTRPSRRLSGPAQDVGSTQDTLASFLGNLGGRQKTWMNAPVASASNSASRMPAPDKPMPPATKKRKPTGGRPPIPIDQPATPPATPPETPQAHPLTNSSRPTIPSTSHPRVRPAITDGDSVSLVSRAIEPASSESTTGGLEASAQSAGETGRSIPTASTLDIQLLQNPGRVPRFETQPRAPSTRGQFENFSMGMEPAVAPRALPSPQVARDYRNPSQLLPPGQHVTDHGRTGSVQISLDSPPGMASATPGARLLGSSFRCSPSVAQTTTEAGPSAYVPSTSARPAANPPTSYQLTLAQLPPETPPNRGHLLRRALEERDSLFLFLHQLYCTFNFLPLLVPPQIRGHANLDVAFKFMAHTIGFNSDLHQNVLEFFHRFPVPLQHFASNDNANYRKCESLTLEFLRLIPNLFGAFGTRAFHMGHPPLVQDMVRDLGVHSPIFQELIFELLLREIFNRLLVSYGFKPTPQSCSGEYVRACLNVLRDCQSHSRRTKLTDNDYAVYARRLLELRETRLRTILSSSGQSFAGVNGNQHNQHLRTQPPAMAPSQVQHAPFHMPNPPVNPPVNASLSSPGHAPWAPVPSQNATFAAMPGGMAIAPNAFAGVQPPTVSRPRIRPGSERSAAQQVGARQRNNRRLLPPPGSFLHIQRLPNPAVFALHHASLRDAELCAKSKNGAEINGDSLFQYVSDFVLKPSRPILPLRSAHTWTLKFSAEDLTAIARQVEGNDGAPPKRFVDVHTRSLRLRCIKWSTQEPPTQHDWVRMETSWPECTYFRFNDKHLLPRRKIHYGRDLAIDISSLVREGENTLSVDVAHAPEAVSMGYLLAIEDLRMTTYDMIMDSCLVRNRIAKDAVRAAISRRMATSNTSANPEDDEDDLIVMPPSYITIPLVDPFSGKSSYQHPVRSRACAHDNCFDLAIFLTTRRRVGDVSDPDIWKCPVCNGDARPQFLGLDEFVAEVMETMRRRGVLAWSRSVKVFPDLEWEAQGNQRGKRRVSASGHDSRSPTTFDPTNEEDRESSLSDVEGTAERDSENLPGSSREIVCLDD